MNNYVGSGISLISNSGMRYVGILLAINAQESTVSLSQVRSFGTEGRRPNDEVPPNDQVFDTVVFRGSDIKDLQVLTTNTPPPAPPPPALNDPAIISSRAVPPAAGTQGFVAPNVPPQAQQFQSYSNLNYPPNQPNHFMVPPYPLQQNQQWTSGYMNPNMPNQMGIPPVNPQSPPGIQIPQVDEQFTPQQTSQPMPQGLLTSQPQPSQHSLQTQQQTVVSQPVTAQPSSPKKVDLEQNTPTPVKAVKQPLNSVKEAKIETKIESAKNERKFEKVEAENGEKEKEPKPDVVDFNTIAKPENHLKPTPVKKQVTVRESHSSRGRPYQNNYQNYHNNNNNSNNNNYQNGNGSNQNEERLPGTGGHLAYRGRGTRGNRRFNGRGGNRNSTRIPVPESDFDFASMNAKFNKPEDEEVHEDEYYNKNVSFFDNISCEMKEKTEGERVDRRARQYEERRLNLETFGQVSIDNQRWRGRGRGRGRGGYGRGAPSQP